MTHISDAQREHLSAYLDGALPDHERIALEQRLQDDMALAEEVRELQITTALLRDLPAIQPPRTFTLDPAVYARRRGFFAAGWMRWTATLGALALMLTVGLSLSLNGGAQSPAFESASSGDAGGSAPPSAAMGVAQATSDATSETARSSAGVAPTIPTALDSAQAPVPPLEPASTEAAYGGAANDAAPSSTVPTDTFGIAAGAAATSPAFPTSGAEMSIMPAPEGSYPFVLSNTEYLSGTAMYRTDIPSGTVSKMLPGGMIDESGTSSPESASLDQLPDLPLPAATPSAAAEGSGPALLPIFALVLLVGLVATVAVTLLARRFERRR